MTPGKYWHKEKTDSKAHPKAARYEQPIHAMLHIKDSAVSHTSFQSTSSCNISTVNTLNQVGMYVAPKERGRGNQKQHWGVEMNDAGYLYLNDIEFMDHLIQNC